MAISLDELDAHLFKSADLIRDAVDPTDYKEFILPLIDEPSSDPLRQYLIENHG